MRKRVLVLSGIAFLGLALVLVTAGPIVKSIPDQRSPYLDAVADISAPPASAVPPCNYRFCYFDPVIHMTYCDFHELPTLCKGTGPSCETTTNCAP